MTWLRTRSGRLIHAVGGLADVHRARGAVDVADEVALAEVASGEAQVRADVEGEAAAHVDAIVRRADEAKAQRQQGPDVPPRKPRKRKRKTAEVPELVVTHGPPPLTPEDHAAIDKAMDEEGPR